VAFAQKGWVEPSGAFALVSISAISLMVGASLGPSFGIVVSGGGFAAWLVTRQQGASESEKQEYALSGMAGGLGAVFSAPLFAAIMASELSPTPKRDYVSAFIPQFLAATIGGVVFLGVTGRMILDSFDIAGYEFALWHLAAGFGLGLISVVVLVLFVGIERLVRRASGLITDRYVRALTFGALVGLIAFVLPLSAAAGSAQLSFATDNVGALSAWLLAAILVAKMLAVGLSLEAGFLGGTVFPLLFIGGTGGLLVNAVFPEIPASLAVASMIASVPGALVGAPVSFILLGVGTVGIGLEGFGPIGIAVVTSHVTVSALRLRRQAHGL
jgi:H+/Cl- antiporter ClcA